MSESIAELGEAAQQLVLHIIEEIVDHSSAIRVDVTPSNFHLLIELHTAATDIGQVVGKRGSVAESIRTILAAFAGKNRISVTLLYVTEREVDRGVGAY